MFRYGQFGQFGFFTRSRKFAMFRFGQFGQFGFFTRSRKFAMFRYGQFGQFGFFTSSYEFAMFRYGRFWFRKREFNSLCPNTNIRKQTISKFPLDCLKTILLVLIEPFLRCFLIWRFELLKWALFAVQNDFSVLIGVLSKSQSRGKLKKTDINTFPSILLIYVPLPRWKKNVNSLK